MNTKPIDNICPKCGAPIPGDAPEGLCPRCVLAGAAVATAAGFKQGGRIAPPSLATIATAFPQLEVIELLGVGGMGIVYKARQPKLDRFVALKVLPTPPGADPAFAERFEREARFLARLNHPNIVSVFDFGQSGGFCFLLLEYVDGVNLRQAMQAGRFSPAEALAIVPPICGALQYAHGQGVLHRDIKPENILLDARGIVKIADFGIAKLTGDAGGDRADLTLTQSGARLGTPHYMAPEQIENPSGVDHRADVYSLGVVFYELLTGELPLGRFAPPSEKTNLDARIDAIVLRALAKERELRQQSAGELGTQVEGLGNPAGARPAPAATPAAPMPAGLLQSRRTGDHFPDPWPHRLLWLVVAMTALPIAAVIAALLAPIFVRGALAPVIAGFVPMITGALLAYCFARTRPTAADAKLMSAWNPWPKRIFWALLLMAATPVLLLTTGIILPIIVPRGSFFPSPPAVVSPNPDTKAASAEVGGLPEQLPAGTPGAAALKWNFAWQTLERNRKMAANGLVSNQEVMAAERDLAVAEAEFRGRPRDAAAANVTYAEAILEITRKRFTTGMAAREEVNAATLALAQAEEALQKTTPTGPTKGASPLK